MKNRLAILLNFLSPINRKLLIFIIIFYFLSCLLGLLDYVLFSEGNSAFIISHIAKFFSFNPKFIDNDSWEVMKEAFERITSSTDFIYEELFFGKSKIKFQYPLTSLLICFPLSIIAEENLINYLKISSWIAIIITFFYTLRIFKKSCEIAETERENKKNKVIQLTIIFFLTLGFYPIIKAFSLGQIQVWINALFSMSTWYYISNKKKLSGAGVALMCLIKPQYIVIFIWAVARKQWDFAKHFIMIFFPVLILSLIVFGVKNNMDYLKVLSFISKHGESFYANQSMNGLLNRFLFNGANLEWSPNTFAPFNLFVYITTILTSILFISCALFRPLKASERGGIVDYFIICVSTTIASPIAWEHHYGILLQMYAFLFPPLLNKRHSSTQLALLISVYILTSQHIAFINKMTSKTMFNFLQSYIFFGALMFLVYLYWIERTKFKSLQSRIHTITVGSKSQSTS
jgi:alpha-1,2-mannosyltransferase